MTGPTTHILLIEDDAAQRQMVRRLVALRGAGRATLQEAGTMEEGLRLLQTHEFDLVLLDHTLPDGSALDELRLLRGVQPDLCIVMHTGYLSSEDEVLVLAEGAREVVLKGAFEPLWQAILRACPQLHLPPASRDAPVPGPYTVLVVEDDAAVREMVQRVLHDAGYGAVTAENGARAIELLNALPQAVDLVFADVRMPAVSGDELGRVLARSRPTLPVVYTSGWPEEQARETTRIPAEAVILPKPFSPDQLLSVVRGALKQ